MLFCFDLEGSDRMNAITRFMCSAMLRPHKLPLTTVSAFPIHPLPPPHLVLISYSWGSGLQPSHSITVLEYFEIKGSEDHRVISTRPAFRISLHIVVFVAMERDCMGMCWWKCDLWGCGEVCVLHMCTCGGGGGVAVMALRCSLSL